MERVKELQKALAAARMERALAHAKFVEASAKAKQLADELLRADGANEHVADAPLSWRHRRNEPAIRKETA